MPYLYDQLLAAANPEEYGLQSVQGDYFVEGDYDIEGDFDEYEEVEGDYDIQGDEEIGFRLGRRGRARPGLVRRGSRRMVRPAPRRIVRAPAGALASSPYAGPVHSIRQTPPTVDGYSLLPLDTGSVAVAAGATATISAQCQQTFKPMSIVFDAVVSPDFVVTSIKCGNNEQLVGGGELPANIFTVENTQGQLNLAPIPAALSLVISVRNISGAARRLRGGASGYKMK